MRPVRGAIRVTEAPLRVTQTPSFPAAIAPVSVTRTRRTTRFVAASIFDTVWSGLIAHRLPPYAASFVPGHPLPVGRTPGGSRIDAAGRYVSGSMRSTRDVYAMPARPGFVT